MVKVIGVHVLLGLLAAIILAIVSSLVGVFLLPWWIQLGLEKGAEIHIPSADQQNKVVIANYQDPMNGDIWVEITVVDEDFTRLFEVGHWRSASLIMAGYWSAFGACIIPSPQPNEGSWLIVDPTNGVAIFTDDPPPAYWSETFT